MRKAMDLLEKRKLEQKNEGSQSRRDLKNNDMPENTNTNNLNPLRKQRPFTSVRSKPNVPLYAMPDLP
jgi:hypothetical protein